MADRRPNEGVFADSKPAAEPAGNETEKRFAALEKAVKDWMKNRGTIDHAVKLVLGKNLED